MLSKTLAFSGVAALLLFFTTCSAQDSIQKSEAIPVVDFSGIEKLLDVQDDTLRVFNFWATWCKPCVEELPLVEQLPKAYQKKAFRLYYISLDFPNQIDSKLKPFLKNNPLHGEVIVLDDPDANTWIDKVNPEWSGSIPATIVKKGDAMEFHEGKFNTFLDIQNLISQLKNIKS